MKHAAIFEFAFVAANLLAPISYRVVTHLDVIHVVGQAFLERNDVEIWLQNDMVVGV